MNISHFFIDRPVFACVISLIILLAGGVAYVMLPVEQFPNITPPTVSITANYPGANAETVVDTVATPIEKQVNGVDHLLYMSSNCTSDGNMKITVTFEVGTDPDMATVLVQNRVNMASATLPAEVTRQGVTVKKQSTNMVLVLDFYNPKDLADYRQGKRMTAEEFSDRSLYLANNVSINIKDQLARINGVGDVTIFNAQDFSMRIWLNPEVLAARNISVSEITAALQSQNVQVAAGRIGAPPIPAGTKNNVVLAALGRLQNEQEFGDMILRTGKDGSILRLRDVANIELGGKNYNCTATYEGVPTATIAIYQNPGANSIEVAGNVEKILQEMKEKQGLFGDDLTYAIGYDATEYVKVSLGEVKETLIEAIIIVVLIVFLFLQDWRAVLIPTMTVPVSLVGCFFIMWCIGFTVNSLTLFGLILVIGIVVDDAILVVENTQRLIDEENLSPYNAAKKAMDEVGGPIVATTFVLMSIFIPTAMVPGIVGEVYRQFALTIAGAVCISAICALTFAPAMAAIILRKSKPDEKKFFLFRLFNFFFNRYAGFYLRTVKGVIAARWVVLLCWFGLLFAIYSAFMVLPTGFIPNEDQGVLFVDIKLPEGASLERTSEVVAKMQKMFDEDKAGIENIEFISGFSMLDGANATNVAMAILTLTSWENRYPKFTEILKTKLGMQSKTDRNKDGKTGGKTDGKTGGKTSGSGNKDGQKEHSDGLDEIMPRLLAKWTKKFSTIPEAEILVFPPPPVMGLGSAAGIEYQMLDRGGNGMSELFDAAENFCERAQKTGLFTRVQSTFNPYAPRVFLDINRDKVMKMGVSLDEVFHALQSYYGSVYVNDFNKFNSVFSVYIQAQGDYRADAKSVLDMKFKNPDGKMVPISAVATIRQEVGPQRIPRFQLYPTAYISAQLASGVSSGEGMKMLEELSRELPGGFGYSWAGMSYQEGAVGNTTVVVFALCVIFAFFVLAAQYESWTTPIIILMAVPLGIGGALLFVGGRGLDVNIYTQIGFILMVGLSAKNAILITEFAVEGYRHGGGIIESAYEAGRLRLRPIMMTSFAFILGILPLFIAMGAGAVSRHAIGTPVCGGMLTETLIGIYVTPVLFVLLTSLFGKRVKKNKEM
ncbi:MAG: efflux RND transporter permease subunit [Planctomycetaceae bacterium]|jgi:HAE1 family hydrophobic/amphiphilic exporter-1|nr:efflux RND transporter permease subunit [Planctomycetaceae bacterium]